MFAIYQISSLTLLFASLSNAGIIRSLILPCTPMFVTPVNSFTVDLKVDPWRPERFHYEYETPNESTNRIYGGFQLTTRRNNIATETNSYVTQNPEVHYTTHKTYDDGFRTTANTRAPKLSNRYPVDDYEDTIVFPDDYNNLAERQYQDSNTESPQDSTSTEFTTTSDEDSTTTEDIDLALRLDLPSAVVASLLGKK